MTLIITKDYLYAKTRVDKSFYYNILTKYLIYGQKKSIMPAHDF